MWPAGLAAWGGGGRSGVRGRGPPEETGSGPRWCPLTTAEARSVQGAETEAGVRAPWGGAGGATAEPERGSGARPAARRLGPLGAWSRGSGSRSGGGAPRGRPSPPAVAKGGCASGARPRGDDPRSVFSQAVGSEGTPGKRGGKF